LATRHSNVGPALTARLQVNFPKNCPRPPFCDSKPTLNLEHPLSQMLMAVLRRTVGKDKQLPRCEIWHHTSTSFVVAKVNWQSKLSIDKELLAGLLKSTGSKPPSTSQIRNLFNRLLC